ncbi:MAG TPA: HAMP domain-containing sensor histidine kinase [Pseudonocardiaceae bacterium]|nr:HAMP domain-containing sensor histidine kinase [Pseudonocardiaceae bacterium]
MVDTHHLTAILDDLLLAVDPRGSAGDQFVRLPLLVQQAVESARPLADEQGVTIAYATITRQPPVVGVPAGLRRAVTALVDDAIRHARQQVRVSTAIAGRDVVIDVADDGPGIEPDMVSTMFDRFATSSVLAAAPPEGRQRYGLGLALVSEIAHQHGGSVSVVHTDLDGVTPRLRLPAGL